MKTILSIIAAGCLTISQLASAQTVKTILHCGSSIQSDTRGYGGAMIIALAPLKLTNYDYLNVESTSQIYDAFSKTKTQASSNFGSSAWQIADGSSKVYAGYDLVSLTADYHHWRYASGNYSSELDKIFARFRQDYPGTKVFFTGQTPVCGDFGSMDQAKKYNDMARASCLKNKIPFFDMLNFCIQNKIVPGSDCRHFGSADRKEQGTWLGKQMLTALGQNTAAFGSPRENARVLSTDTRLSLLHISRGLVPVVETGLPFVLLNGAAAPALHDRAAIPVVIPQGAYR